MSDLSYKLNQIAKSLHDLGHGAWGDAVAAAGDEIERLKGACRAPDPAMEPVAAQLRRFVNAPGFVGVEVVTIGLTGREAAAILAAHEPEGPEAT